VATFRKTFARIGQWNKAFVTALKFSARKQQLSQEFAKLIAERKKDLRSPGLAVPSHPVLVGS
jgi:hypothetical protein